MPMPGTYLDLLQPGDLVLSGGPNFFSEVTQWATGSRFGHAMIVLGDRRLIQATDISLTPPENDEGVFTVTFRDFRTKTATLSDIRVVRPASLDTERLGRIADYLIEHSPTYPSVGAILLGFGCAITRFVAVLPPAAKDWIVRQQFRLIADGPTRMHCAELVVRLYDAAGLSIELATPVLADIIAHSRGLQPRLLEVELEKRQAVSGVWPSPLPRAALFAVHGVATTLLARLDLSVERDHAGLVLPADLERSPTFAPVFDITRRRHRWELNPAA